MDKLAKHEGLLDSLPDSILCHILSFLLARDAVRTSVLSPRWRYLFTSSISRLDFDDIHVDLPNSQVPEEHIESFKKFVDRLFSNPKHLSLESFVVSDRSLDADCLPIDNWLCAALLCGVKEIDVHLFPEEIRKLSTLLFTCPSLVTLKLDMLGSEMKLPTNVCLPNLSTLHLSDMELVDGCSFHGLISGCPVLQDFDLSDCYLTGASELNIHSLSLRRLVLEFENLDDFGCVIVIDAPNLVYFEYFCRVGKICILRTMESLEKADITISPEPCASLFQAICKVHVLHLSIIGYDDSLFQRPLDPVLAFHNLVELKFKNRCVERTIYVAWILEFLHCAPNLKTLIMDFVDSNTVFELLPEEVPTCLLYHLNKIEILYITADTHMFEMVSYFLNHALVLEKLVMRSRSIDSPQECRSSIIEKLSSLPKKSKKCKFIVR
ncbi:hypothetical protein V6N13_038607 [Hibiscus sabdariffa]|uniref:Uncharacterized protein n=2 Tax=Hibiscus sabdariffa TaxID=183260 RepID=A0ABR2B5H1_9ROSI